MTDEPIYKCWCKATNREKSGPRYSKSWVVSRRAWFRIYRDRIDCSGWVIPYPEVNEAIMYNTRVMFIPVQVLELVTDTGRYQFGFNPWASPSRHLPFEISQQNLRIRYSPFSIVVRLLAVTFLIYWVWDRWVNI